MKEAIRRHVVGRAGPGEAAGKAIFADSVNNEEQVQSFSFEAQVQRENWKSTVCLMHAEPAVVY